jgi:hypothetical protein
MIPLENTSRWPRLVIQRGRKASSATKLVRNGNPLKLVIAAGVEDQRGGRPAPRRT